MLKRKLSKTEYEAMAEAIRAFYKQDGDNYVLNVETSADDDPGELRRARDREKENAKTEKERADRLQVQVDTLVADPNKQKDIKTLETSWQNKLADKERELSGKITRLTEQLKKAFVGDVARRIANKLAGDNADVLMPHLERRLQANLDGDEPSTRVLDVNGAASASTLEDLEKEFVANTKFSAIIVASRASGGAGGSGRANSGAGSGSQQKKFGELSDAERSDFFKRDPEGFKRASEAAAAVARRF